MPPTVSRYDRHVTDLAQRKWRSRFEAWVLDACAETSHELNGERISDGIGSMTGTVVELGPGTGVNMRYYAPGVHVIAIEPNPQMHSRLRDKAGHHDVDLEVRTVYGERIDVADASVDAVVGTLVLCGVDDPTRVIDEAYRVLKPGGRYFFIEHVRAPESTWTQRFQRIVRRPHRWLFNGCRTDQDTAAILASGPFDDVEIDEQDRGASGLYVRHGIIGTATKA